jgi:hypothetical protein
MTFFLPRTNASIEADVRERDEEHERDVLEVEHEDEVERDPETGLRPGIVERVKDAAEDAVERTPHPQA